MFSIVLTDLQTDDSALLEAVSTQQQQGRTVVAQIGAAWRLSLSLEEAYVEYQSNHRILQRLRHLGLAVFDIKPERLIESVAQQISKQPTAKLAITKQRVD